MSYQREAITIDTHIALSIRKQIGNYMFWLDAQVSAIPYTHVLVVSSSALIGRLGSDIQLAHQVPTNVNRDRWLKYNHPKGAPDADAVFGSSSSSK